MNTQPWLELLASLLNSFATIVLYGVIGFGPGFIVGVLLANRIAGRNHPLRIDKYKQNIQKATEHNSQWHPNHPRWQ